MPCSIRGWLFADALRANWKVRHCLLVVKAGGIDRSGKMGGLDASVGWDGVTLTHFKRLHLELDLKGQGMEYALWQIFELLF